MRLEVLRDVLVEFSAHKVCSTLNCRADQHDCPGQLGRVKGTGGNASLLRKAWSVPWVILLDVQ